MIPNNAMSARPAMLNRMLTARAQEAVHVEVI